MTGKQCNNCKPTKRFKPFTIEDYKTVKQWKEWLSQFDDDCKVETILKQGEGNYELLDAWSGRVLFFRVKE